MKNRIIILGLTWLSVVLLITLAATFIPSSRTEKTIDFTMINPALTDVNFPADLPIYLLEELQVLKLAYPQQIWLEDMQLVTLSIIPKTINVSQKMVDSGQEKYHAYLEARLELGLVHVLSGDSVIEAVKENQPAQFLWQVKPVISGRTNGLLWIFVNITDSHGGAAWQLTRFALPISMEVKDIIGLSLSSARILILAVLVIAISALLVLRFIVPQKSRMI
jgi:hypothetical protein